MKILAVASNKTQLFKSPSDLSVLFSRDHNLEKQTTSDVAFFTSTAADAFVQIYKNTDLIEVYRINKDNETEASIEYITKFRDAGVQAITCAKNTEGSSEFAVGYTNGRIKMFSMKQRTKKDFPCDPKKASVLSMDINSNNQMLASVYENGSISIFGIKTNVRTAQLDKIKEATSARFSPSNRLHLAVASYIGDVHLYDFNNNQKLLFSERAHDAPCRDIAMCENNPSRLYTCGLDSLIKIFDIRKKNSGLQISLDCGLTSISVESEGNYIVAGNLKGNVIAYDVRNLKRPLSAVKVDDDSITRVAFIPSVEKAYDRMTFYKEGQQTIQFAEDLPDAPEQSDKKLIDDVHNFSRGRLSEFEASFQSSVSRIGSETKSDRQSDFFGKGLKNALTELDFNCDDVFESGGEEPQFSKTNKNRNSNSKRRSSFLSAVNSPLQRIREETNDKENHKDQYLTPVAPPRYSSTPATAIKITIKKENEDESLEVIDVDALESPNIKTIAGNSHKAATQNLDLRQEFDKIHEKIKIEVQSLNMDMFQRHIELSDHMTEQRMKMQERMGMIEDCVAMMMNEDFKIAKIMELQKENQDLRRDMNELIKKMNSLSTNSLI